MNQKIGIKQVVAIGIGTALFAVLTMVQVPLGFIPNTSLQVRMAVLAFFSAVFGPVVGGLSGILGHALGDAIFYGSVWWSWVFPEAVVGVGIGLFMKKLAVEEGEFKALLPHWIFLFIPNRQTRYFCRESLPLLETLLSSVFWEPCFWLSILRLRAPPPV